MVLAQRIIPTVLVQTADTLPGSDSGWTTQRWVRAVSGSGGSNQALGEWTLEQDFGIVKPSNAAAFTSAGIAPDITRAGLVDDLVGLVVRLLKSDDDGSITVNGHRYTAFWHGVIQAQSIEPDLAPDRNTGGRATWLAVGIGAVLDGIHLDRGWVYQSGGAVDPGYLPPFNHQPGGDRSDSPVSINGLSVYVHQLGDATAANEWTAFNIAELLLAGAATPTLAGGTTAYGWSWSLIIDDGGCLDYIPEDLDLGGLTLLQALNELISTKRALTWTVEVSGNSAFIRVRSASPEAIAIGTYILPAASDTATLDVTDPDVAPWISGLVIEQDEASTYDAIVVRGAPPWTGLTLAYPDHLAKGWNPSEETAHAGFPSLPLYEQVYRRFTLSPTWDETAFGGGLENTPQVETSSAYGVNGLNGERSVTASADRVPGYVHAGERMVPCAEQFSSSGIGPRQAPVIVVYNGSNLYEDMSLKWRVEIQNEPFAIVIDDGKNGLELKTRLAAEDAKIYVTVGMREHRPIAVSWQRSPGEFPRATPRVKLIQAQGCELWRVGVGSITGVDGDKVRGAVGTDLTLVSPEIVARDDRGRLRAVLALARAWFAVPGYRARWTDRGNLDIGDTYAPGVLLTSVTLGDRTYGTYALITRRTWQLVKRDDVEMWDTVYETQRIIPDLEVIL
ncbi:MAG: hypothetical protein V4537_18095 [Pseudomonadota bacterium]